MERLVGFLFFFVCVSAISIVGIETQDAYVFNSPRIFVKLNCTSCEIYNVQLTNNTPNTFTYQTIFVPHYLVNETGIIELLVEEQSCSDYGTEYNYTVQISSSEGTVSQVFIFNITSPLEAKLDKSVVTSEIATPPRIHLLLKNKGSNEFETNVSLSWDGGYTKIFNRYGIFASDFQANLSYSLMNTIELLPNKFGKGTLTIDVTTACASVNTSFTVPTSIYSESGLMRVKTLDFLDFIFKLFKPLLLS